MTIKELLKYYDNQIEECRRNIDFINANAEKLLQFEPKLGVGSPVDIENPTRAQVLDVIKTFPGDWEKNTYSGRMNYCLTLPDDLGVLRCWDAALPPSCELITVKKLVLEHYEEVMEVRCHKDLAIATAMVETEATSKN
jgi:hypothetical protein